MLTLAFDTSASGFSVALLDDSKILAKNIIRESGKQSELLIPEIEKILRGEKIWYQDLGLIAVTSGPGSFTGTRIGLTVARILTASTKLPLILVNCCEATAFAHRQQNGKIFVALDAAMNELFIAEYFCENKKIREVMEPRLIKQEELSQFLPKDNFFLCSNEEKDFVEADFVGLLALEKFHDKNFSKNHDALYLREPRISERKK